MQFVIAGADEVELGYLLKRTKGVSGFTLRERLIREVSCKLVASLFWRNQHKTRVNIPQLIHRAPNSPNAFQAVFQKMNGLRGWEARGWLLLPLARWGQHAVDTP